MSTMASQNTNVSMVCSTVCSGTDQRKKTKALHHWPLWGEFTSDRWIPPKRTSNAKNVTICWHHHVSRCEHWSYCSLALNHRDEDYGEYCEYFRENVCCHNRIRLHRTFSAQQYSPIILEYEINWHLPDVRHVSLINSSFGLKGTVIEILVLSQVWW